ncbi:hypothetical protein WH95_01115 [Kiloniella litopenaei]|uniref:DUF4760 domain-containing protein n=1 Tax=Kiloniella litopenaei TaxID=1549748 RepID=A0A0M2RAN9_9PROT|nr:hypothetical protein [Kiloniella litopenaei]KKJ78711.1 hypothetical protein WH95_01115 [Kiloniella litopenaei]
MFYDWLFEDSIASGVCSNASFCIAHFQTLISGSLAVIAAVCTAGVVYWSASMPIRQQKERDKIKDKRIKTVIDLEFRSEMNKIAKRAITIKSTIVAYRAANTEVNDNTRPKLFLPEPELAQQRELMAFLGPNTTANFLSLMLQIYAHQDNIRDTNTFMVDAYFEQVTKRLELIGNSAQSLANKEKEDI